MKILLLTFLLLSTFVFSQNQDNNLILRSQGDLPSFLHDKDDSYFIYEKNPWVIGNKNYTRKFLLDLVFSSNAIVFGDEISTFCKSILKEKTGISLNVYTVRSNKVATFSDNEGNLFITSGTISQLSNETQLLFFLYRETLRAKSGYKSEIVRRKSELNLDILIDLLSQESLETDKRLDKEAWDYITQKLAYSNEVISGVFDILFYQETPFYEKKFDWTYFNNGFGFIPNVEFLKNVNPNPNYYNPADVYPQIQQRKANLVSIPTVETVLTSDSSTIVSREFKQIVNLARMETIQLNILKGNFHQALYEIYVLESFEVNDQRMDFMKAYAWMSILKEKRSEIRPIQHSVYEASDNEGAFFGKFLRRQNDDAICAWALRISHDLKQKYASDERFEFINKEIIRLCAKTSAFKLGDFEKQSTTAEQFQDRSIQLENSKQKDKIKSYYYFILPDLASDSTFVKLLESYKTPKIEEEVIIKKVDVINVDLTEIKRGNEIKSEITKFTDAELLMNDKNNELNFEIKTSNWNTAEYNSKYYYSSAINQNYYYSAYSSVTTPFFNNELKTNLKDKSTVSAIFVYNHSYRLKLKNLHFLALFVIPIPYLIPELFYSGNQASFAGFYFNNKTGELEHANYLNYHDPSSKRLLKNVVMNTTLNNYKTR